MKKVAIIGGGIGGLATGIRLLHKGFQVEIYEKENTVGGKVNLFQEKGYSFDFTASIAMMHNTYGEIFNDVGKNPWDYYSWEKIDPIYRIFYSSGEILDIDENINDFVKKLENKGEDSQGYLEYVSAFFNVLRRSLLSSLGGR